MKNLRRMASLLIVLVAVQTGFAQSRQETVATTQAAIDEAQRALTAAENIGAPVYARDLYDDAMARLSIARQTANDDKRSLRETARLRAIEARHAARAAEAKARWVVNTTEARNLRDDLGRFGGSVPAMTFADDPAERPRGDTSLNRVDFAQSWLDRANAAGGQLVAPEDMRTAESWLESARRIAKADRQNESADHLAYTSEMLARRAYYLALRSEVDRVLPGLRLERTRLAQVATERAAEEERVRREQAERAANEMRDRLQQAENDRRAQRQELDSLRAQLSQREHAIQSQLETDRMARLESERRLAELLARYETAVTRADATEVDNLRRQVEDERFRLQSVQEQQRLSEQTATVQIERLREELERERTSGKATESALLERQTQLTRREQELEKLRLEREESIRRANEMAGRMEQRAREAEAESQRLRNEVQEAEERTRVAQQQAALTQAELERVRAVNERLERMRLAVGAGGTVTTDTRGLIVTLPGIYFDSGRATLKPGARNTLARIADELENNTAARVTVEGHTDSVGADGMNLALSERRANAVRDYLVTQGIGANRIAVTGRGEAAPVATNDTPAGRQQNRRVELIIAQ